MSQVKIALQPPPNVDFVVGYPGIPPGARDRPQAAVKGAVEVRVGNQGVKAKWVRVELKKIETLPGGGQTNCYFDFVGRSPVNLWQSSEEYGLLESQDLPFEIRIPESIPPSLALEKGVGIRYELVATVCTLGKKGFFRRRKTIVTSSATTINIDKHELHSTWPVYAQPESRFVTQEGVHLTVERQRTCFGPGDRVSVMAILKSDSIHPVVLRGFEFSLKETTVFRAGPQAGGKRSGPQVKAGIVGEQKVPLNVTLFAGMQHKAEVGCLIPGTHTTTTLNAARHIDITYAIVVRAWFGSMQSVLMELPVIVSNWPRSVSEEAVRRIGVAPSLCMVTPSSTAPTVPIPPRPLTGNSQMESDYNSSTHGHGRTPLSPPATSIQYKSSPSAQNDDSLEADELGALQGHQSRTPGTVDHPGYISSPNSMGSIQEDGTGTARPVAGPGRRRRGSATATGTQNRLTITNISDLDAEVREAVEQEQLATRLAQPTTPSTRNQRSWLSAEEEKKKLYENARARVERVQGSAAMTSQPSETSSSQLKSSSSARAAWPSAEEEKIRLFDKAQATAKRTQALGTYSSHSRESSETHGSPGISQPSRSISAISAGAALYQHAVSSMNKNPQSNTSPGNSANVSPARSPDLPSLPALSPSKTAPHYPSAEDEKAALKRYHDAKLAVDRSQNTQYASREGISSSSAPVAYDTLYPSSSVTRNGSYNAPNQPGGSDMPPPFDGPDGQPHYLNEKERLRRQYEAQDAAALAVQSPAVPSDMSPSYTASPSYSPPGQSSVLSALSEKELLRRRYEEQDAAALAQQQQTPLPPPPRA
ncbi:hypothetical protein AZE42_02737, partial [Rhizopogon vesiculosus]